ncbi:UbiA family prenyltransferase [Stackebrandtia endophytica]|nr:UbiA family prenyltransferase [Stackebrandtia endophytica]
MLALLKAGHFGPSVTVTAVGFALSLTTDRPLWLSGVLAAAVFTGQLSIGWSNDWIDHPRDVAIGRSDKPIAIGGIGRRFVGVAALVALGCCVPLSLAASTTGWLHLIAVGWGWWYNAHGKSTILSVLPYVVAFGLLVLFAIPDAPWWMVAAGAVLGGAAHFANVLPDLADDAATGVRGLPHRIGRRPSTVGTVVLLATAAGLLLARLDFRWAMLTVSVTLLGAAAVAVSRSRSRFFLLVQLVALINVMMLLSVAFGA